jgi:hypothetical protein
MGHAVTLRGRLQGRHIELERPVTDLSGEVEVVVRPVSAEAPPPSKLLDLIRTLPPGTRSKEDIDRQLNDERDEWERRG